LHHKHRAQRVVTSHTQRRRHAIRHEGAATARVSSRLGCARAAQELVDLVRARALRRAASAAAVTVGAVAARGVVVVALGVALGELGEGVAAAEVYSQQW